MFIEISTCVLYCIWHDDSNANDMCIYIFLLYVGRDYKYTTRKCKRMCFFRLKKLSVSVNKLFNVFLYSAMDELCVLCIQSTLYIWHIPTHAHILIIYFAYLSRSHVYCEIIVWCVKENTLYLFIYELS